MFLPAVAAAGVTYDTLSNASVTDDTFSAASVSYDTVALNIQTVTVSAPLKRDGDYRRLPVAASTLGSKELNGDFIVEPKNLSLTVPNMMHADYGARMTGSIYMRGLGSRMDQPAVGLYVDGVPVMNKNNYDFDYFDLARIDVLRGPQGTLYGRNTVGGVVDVQTLSPMDYQGVRVGAGYGNGNSWHVQGAVYARPTAKFGFSVAASHRATDGFFTNSFDGSHADSGRSSALRFKLQGRLGRGWMVENSLYANLVRQNGFAYAPYDEATGRAGIIDHNDPTTYDRVGLTDGLTFRRDGARVRVSSTTSWQFTDDDMVLDQDFSPRSMFTLRQSQRENAFTQEVVLRSATSGGSQARRWQWLTGFFGFYRHLETEAPVVFKRDGIDELILANANNGIHTAFPDADLLIREESFPVDSRFRLPAYGLSLYHQSTWRRGRWSLTAGVRADWEHTAINYTNSAEIHYRFTLTMPDYKALPVEMNGRRGKAYFEVMPRVAAMYELPAGSLYASIARGYKAGGYNTQIFSDIVQNRMMGALMEDLGVYFDGVGEGGSAEDAISYRPERSWNYEVGGHFGWLDGRLQVDAALFWIDCRNQQLTVFPAGNGIGRLMSNAGRTRSAGAEVAAAWRVGDLRLTGAWGHTSARFLSYDDGREDYAGNIVPYAPRNTVSLQGEYRIGLSGRGGASGDSSGGGVFSGASALLLTVGGQAAGPIVWNEGNTLTQRLYGLMNASVAWETARLSVSVWARNMTGTEYNTFYFKSVGRSFVQRGKPLQAGVTVALNL
jgi:outer membrane receptor protein involved in Fe transport